MRGFALIALGLLPRLLSSQGSTTAAVMGSVAREDGVPIAGATVTVTKLTTGGRWAIVTGSGGRYLLEGVAIGGPYRIEARAIGFTALARTGFVLALGQRLVVSFVLEAAPLQLPSLSVRASRDPVLDPGRTGPAETISEATIAQLPNPRRDFLQLTLLSPQAALSPSSSAVRSGGITIGGQNRMLNSYQIDGGVNHDLFRGGLPGRESLPRPISLEAIEEIQLHAAPFDVRYGGFAGGLVNTVTKSGSNTLHGSAFSYLADAALLGRNATGNEAGDFTTWQFGATTSGPLLRDRAHYFLSVDLQRRAVPDPGPFISDTIGGADTARIGIRYASAVRFQEILRNTWDLDPGTLGPSDSREPAEDVVAKLSSQLLTNSQLEASYHYSHGDRSGQVERRYGLYALSSVAQKNPSTTHAARLIWTSLLDRRWSNELIVSYLRLRDRCQPATTYPRIFVQVDRGQLRAGTGGRCPTEAFGQDILEVTENATIALGNHVVTLGAHGELLHFSDGVLNNSAGFWGFRGLNELQVGRAFSYGRAFQGSGGRAGVGFRVQQMGLYAQDRWTPVANVTMTAGLRVDVPTLPDRIPTNTELEAALGVDTGRLPSGPVLWSPRLGVNYDVRGEGRTFLRGGAGLFSGRPPYTWLGSAYHDHGQELVLICAGSQVPTFDPLGQPGSCLGGGGAFPQISFFEAGTRFPRNLKVALGLDQRLPGGVAGTLDVLYTRAVNQLYLSDANMGAPVVFAAGEAGRPLYGSFNAANGVATTTARRVANFREVIRVSNRNGDEALSLSIQLRRRFGRGIEGGALYAYTRAKDRMSLVAFQARGNLDFSPLDGTLEDRRLTTSLFEIPHRVQLHASVALPFQARLSLSYAGASGMPFTYTIDGDANADGLGTIQPNDIVYVPQNPVPGGDISLVQANPQGGLAPAAAEEYARLNAFIREEPCLRTQRGRILARNSCRNPWFGTLNVNLSKSIPTTGTQTLELVVGLYNAFNLLSREWGQYRTTQNNLAAVPMIRLVGYEPEAGRGVYQLTLPARNEVVDLPSRWQIELGARYAF